MKKGYYIFPCGYIENAKEYIGVQKKIKMQCREFAEYFSIEYIPVYEYRPKTILGKIRKRLFWHSANRNYQELLSCIINPDFLYIRRTTADKKFIEFIKKIKSLYPQCKIIVEIYTFPYEKDEYKGVLGLFGLIKDRHYRKYYKFYVDRFVTYSNDLDIFSVPTINTINGVDTKKFTPIKPRPEDNEIHLVAIAMFQNHHGYERVISGMYQYYLNGGGRDIKLFMVGDGPELSKYKELVHKYHLSERVMFLGKMVGDDLNRVYNMSDIGLGSFALYKIGLDTVSSLKSKEYLAKGLPIVAGISENFVNEKIRPYYLAFPNDSSIIDINKIVDFHDSIYNQNDSLSKEAVANKLHLLADDSVSMRASLKPVVDYILE